MIARPTKNRHYSAVRGAAAACAQHPAHLVTRVDWLQPIGACRPVHFFHYSHSVHCSASTPHRGAA